MSVGYGPVETAVRLDVGVLGELKGVQPSLAETAYALARELDAGAGMATAAIARELRATLAEITKDVRSDDATAAFIATLHDAELSAPMVDTTQPRAPHPRAPGGTDGKEPR